MSLRKARIDDFWRRVFKRNYDTQLINIAFSGDNILSQIQLSLNRGVNCIVGKNGIGKSNFIRLLYNVFCDENSNRAPFKLSIINSGEIVLNLRAASDNAEINCDLTAAEYNIEQLSSIIYDPCNTIPNLQTLINSQSNFEELLDGYSTRKLNQEEIDIINYLANNRYEEVELTIIEDEFEEFKSIPFFKVKIDSIEYDIRTMGLGELSLFYFYWLVSYLNTSDKKCILLIEEPESFLPPSTQERLINILAKFISEKGVQTLISTHSEHILKRIPRENIHIFKRDRENLISRKPNDNFEFLKVIGLSAPKKALLLFEDSAAIVFFKTIIRNSKEFVIDSFYYYKSGSDGEIITDLKTIPSKIETFRIVGVFDGDCRNNQLGLSDESLFSFLPSDTPPESLLIDFIDKIENAVLADLFNRTEEQIADAIDETNGADYHDYFEIFIQALNLDYNFTLESLFGLWINTDNNIEKVEAFLHEFREKVE